jgi:hypothetical protein
MAVNGDPYRILGLPTGAPLAEVKRAYRRLAKENHPDTAGEAAIPRFLAIQAAYEALVGSDGRGRRRPGVARPAPWQADAERARATREAWRARSARAGRRPPDADEGGTEAAGTAPGAARGGARRRGGGRRPGADRPPDRATPGSTSYDHAEPYDPEWTGASWYGQSSGTYWTINPKEYADPRKHGPEYQARGRRRESDDDDPQPAGGLDPHDESHAAPETEAGPEPAPERARPRPRPPAPPVRPEPPPPPAWSGSTVAARVPPGPWSTGAGGRVALALVGWPPIGLGVALAAGELSGCSRFAATCVEPLSGGIWLAQAAIIALLLALPVVAAIAAAGSLAVLAAAIPSAVILSALGGSRSPGAAAGVLIAMLAAAWLVGVAVAVARRSRTVRP